MLRRVRPTALVSALLLCFIFGFSASAQQLATAPDPSAGIQYVATTCGGGVRCSDLNSGLSWGSAKATVLGAMAAVPSGKVPHIFIAGGTYSFSSTLQLPVGTNNASCLLEGASAATGQGGGAGTLQDANTTLLSYTGTGVAIDQVETNTRYQSVRGCILKNLSIDGQRNRNTGVTAIRFGGVLGFTLDNVQVSNFSQPSDIAVLVDNESGMFTEQWDFPKLVISNDTLGVEFRKETGGRESIEHGFGNFIWNQFSGQTGLSIINGASIANSFLINNGNFSGSGCTAFSVDSSSSTGSGNTAIYWGVEENGSCVRYSVASGGTFDVYSIVTTNAGRWSDRGSPTIEGFNNGNFIVKRTITAKRSLNVGSGSAITSSGTGGTMASSGPNGISAGRCTTNSSGYCSHIFRTPYSATPVCTSGRKAVANSSGVIVYALSGTAVNWICYPQTN